MLNPFDTGVQQSHTLIPRWRAILDTVATISIIVVCATLTWVLLTTPRQAQPSSVAQAGAPTRPPSQPVPALPLPKEPISLQGAALLGNANAKVAIIEYSDFQCPYCSAFVRDTLPAIQERYMAPGKVMLAFRHLPLQQLHPFALKAGEAAECAGRQGKFWKMHDILFKNQRQLNDESFERFANDIGLLAGPFGTCLAGEASDRVKQDAASATALAVSGTPTFFVGVVERDGRVKVTQRLTGALPPKQFEVVLDKLLAGT
jgi:protein-disulfide isomerase